MLGLPRRHQVDDLGDAGALLGTAGGSSITYRVFWWVVLSTK
jgi:hypothetical protein